MVGSVEIDGTSEGADVGVFEGSAETDGTPDGTDVGVAEGSVEFDGALEGSAEGLEVGELDGAAETGNIVGGKLGELDGDGESGGGADEPSDVVFTGIAWPSSADAVEVKRLHPSSATARVFLQIRWLFIVCGLLLSFECNNYRCGEEEGAVIFMTFR